MSTKADASRIIIDRSVTEVRQVTLQNVPENVWRAFKASAVLQGITMAEAFSQAVTLWLQSTGRMVE